MVETIYKFIRRMEASLAQKAVAYALAGNWKEAVLLNKQILRENSQDVDALNRLARAYSELGKIEIAKKTSEKVLKLDPFNKIAVKALEKWKSIKKIVGSPKSISNPEAFLEEPGKTKLVSLLYLGDPSSISKLDCGDEVKLIPHSHRVNILSQEGKYLGRLPDDLSARLRRLINAGNSYNVLVKSIGPNDVKVFIREVARSQGASDVSSFPVDKIDYISYTPPELVRKKETITPDDEEEVA